MELKLNEVKEKEWQKSWKELQAEKDRLANENRRIREQREHDIQEAIFNIRQTKYNTIGIMLALVLIAIVSCIK